MTNRFRTPARILAVIAGCVALAGCGRQSKADQDKAAASRRPVRVAPADRGVLPDVVAVSGTLGAEEQVDLGMKVGGRLSEIAVDLGSRPREGQVLARLAPTEFELRVRQAEAALAQARARLGLAPGAGDAVVPRRDRGRPAGAGGPDRGAGAAGPVAGPLRGEADPPRGSRRGGGLLPVGREPVPDGAGGSPEPAGPARPAAVRARAGAPAAGRLGDRRALRRRREGAPRDPRRVRHGRPARADPRADPPAAPASRGARALGREGARGPGGPRARSTATRGPTRGASRGSARRSRRATARSWSRPRCPTATGRFARARSPPRRS